MPLPFMSHAGQLPDFVLRVGQQRLSCPVDSRIYVPPQPGPAGYANSDLTGPRETQSDLRWAEEGVAYRRFSDGFMWRLKPREVWFQLGWWRRGRVELPVQKVPQEDVLQAYPALCCRPCQLSPAKSCKGQPIILSPAPSASGEQHPGALAPASPLPGLTGSGRSHG